jgi:hypothetical protein
MNYLKNLDCKSHFQDILDPFTSIWWVISTDPFSMAWTEQYFFMESETVFS